MIVVTTDDGTLVGTCIAQSDGTNAAVAACSVEVSFGAVVLVTEDVATVASGYAPSENPQRWDIPVSPPDGEFGGPVFVNLPRATDATPEATTQTPSPTGVDPLSACFAGPSPTPTPDASLALSGYVVVYGGDTALFVAWMERDGELAGTLRLTYRDVDTGDYRSEERSFVGSRSGNQISLNFGPEFDYRTISGTFDSEELSLYLTADDGTTFPVVLEPGTLAEYEQGVVTLRQLGEAEDACAAELGATATAITAREDAVAAANRDMGSALQTLSDDVIFLTDDTDFEFELESYEGDWKTMKADDRSLRRSAGKAPRDCYELESLGYELEGLGYDQETLGYDRESLKYRADSIASRIDDVEADIIAVRDASDALDAAVMANTNGGAGRDYSAIEVDEAIDDAEAKIQESEGIVADARGRADQIDRAAERLYSDASALVETLTCSNDGS